MLQQHLPGGVRVGAALVIAWKVSNVQLQVLLLHVAPQAPPAGKLFAALFAQCRLQPLVHPQMPVEPVLGAELIVAQMARQLDPACYRGTLLFGDQLFSSPSFRLRWDEFFLARCVRGPFLVVFVRIWFFLHNDAGNGFNYERWFFEGGVIIRQYVITIFPWAVGWKFRFIELDDAQFG